MARNVARRLIESLQTLDRWLLLAVNAGQAPWLDRCMVFFTDRYVWFPAYFVIVVALCYRFGRQALLLLPLLGLAVALADVVSSRVFKPFFGRLRPCHDRTLAGVLKLVNGCGGQYGFLSSHAANSFALATFLCLVLPRRYRVAKGLILGWAALVSYSRIYLGAHYPSDVLAGALLGSLIAWLCAQFYQRSSGRLRRPSILNKTA